MHVRLGLVAAWLACATVAHAEGAAQPLARPATGVVAHDASVAGAQAPSRTTGIATAKDGTRLYYERLGSGPAIVFIHGLGGNHAVWFQQAAHFATTHTVLTLSQRGFAPSGGSQEHYDVGVLVEDLASVMEAAQVGRAAIVGQSMGGWTALAMTLAHPERVRGLILADTVAGISDGEIAAHHQKMIAQARAISTSPPPLGVHPALEAEFSRANPAMGYLYQTLSTFGSPKPGAIAAQLAAATVDAELLRANRVPTLFLVGNNDTVFPPSIIRRAASHVSASEVVEIEGGHSPYFEHPAVWNRQLELFLAAHPDKTP